MNSSHRLALAAAFLLSLAACGAKGPLILPEKAAPIGAPSDAPTDNTPQIEDPATTPADEKAEEAVEDPAPPAADD